MERRRTFTNEPAQVFEQHGGEYEQDWNGLDELIDAGVDLFASAPKPPPRAIHKARELLTKARTPRFTALHNAALAYSAALLRLRLKPTATQMRVLLALNHSVPAEILTPEKKVLGK